MTNEKFLDNLNSIRNKLDLDFSLVLNDITDLPQDSKDNFKTIYNDSVLETLDKLKDIVIQIKNIDSMIDTYKSKHNI